MKVVFVTDLAPIQGLLHDDSARRLLYSMVKKCIIQTLLYLKQSCSITASHQIHVGFKCCDSRSGWDIPKRLAYHPRPFTPFTSHSAILQAWRDEYTNIQSARSKYFKTKGL